MILAAAFVFAGGIAPGIAANSDDDAVRECVAELEKDTICYLYLTEEAQDVFKKNLTLSGQLISDLIKRNIDHRPLYAMQLAGILAKLGLPAGREILWNGLLSPNTLVPAIDAIAHSFDKDESKTTLKQEDRARLAALLTHPDTKVRKSAIEACGRTGLPEARTHYIGMLSKSDQAAPGRAAFWLARNFPDMDALKAVNTLDCKKIVPAEIYWLRTAYEELVSKGTPDVRAGAKTGLLSMIRSLPADFAYDQGCVRALKNAKIGMLALPFFMDAFEKSNDIVARCYALEAIAECRGPDSTDFLLERLDQRDIRTSVIAGLNFAVIKDNRERIWKKLADHYKTQPDTSTMKRGEVEFLANHFPEESRPLLEKMTPKMDPLTQMWLSWHINKFKLDDVLADLHQSGIIASTPTPEQKEEMEKQVAEYEVTADADKLFVALNVIQATACFDTEADVIPCPYADLIRKKLAGITQGRFSPTDVKQVSRDPGSDSGACSVEFKLGTNSYRFETQGCRDWYDVASLLKGLNSALASEKRPERFICLETGGQATQLLFCDPVRFLPLAKKYSIPITPDPSNAMKQGLEFENTVRQ